MATILIVEDEAFTAAIIARALTGAGYTVLTASDGPKGLAAARRKRPDMIVMDMKLPKMTGWEVIRQLRSDASLRTIPILGLSSADTSGDRDEAYEAGCDRYETKPVDVPRLLQHIAELVHPD